MHLLYQWMVAVYNIGLSSVTIREVILGIIFHIFVLMSLYTRSCIYWKYLYSIAREQTQRTRTKLTRLSAEA